MLAILSGLLAPLFFLEVTLQLVQPGFAHRSEGQHLRYHFLAGNPTFAESYVPHPMLGWRNAPDSRRTITRGSESYEHKINSLGMHSPECSQEPGPGIFRILILGDSQAITQVSLEHSHPKLLQDCLNEQRAPGDPEYEVLNLGVGGYGFSQNLSMLETYGVDLAPDLVLLQANPANDYNDEFPQFMDCLWEVADRYVLEDGQLVARKATVTVELTEPSAMHEFMYGNSALYRGYTNCMVYEYYYKPDGFLHSTAKRLGFEFIPPGMPLINLKRLKRRFVNPGNFNLLANIPSPETKELLANVQAILARMKQVARASGSQFAIFANPDSAGRRFSSDRALLIIARKLGVPYLDINKRIPDYVDPGVNAYDYMTFSPEIQDAHFDERGNEILAAMVCEWLHTRKLVRRAPSPSDPEGLK